MRWQDFGRSANVEDRRGQTGIPGEEASWHWTVIVLGLIGWRLVSIRGFDRRRRNGEQDAPGHANRAAQQGQTGTPSDDTGQFVASVLASTRRFGRKFCRSKKALPTSSRTRFSTAAARPRAAAAPSRDGAFYARKTKSLSRYRFFPDMKRRLGGGGDFAYAMSSRMRSAITSKTCSAFCRKFRRRSSVPRARAMRAARIICRYVSNSWPIAWLASGPPIRNAAANSLRRATSNQRSRPRRR